VGGEGCAGAARGGCWREQAALWLGRGACWLGEAAKREGLLSIRLAGAAAYQ
jgi:hypothetical protein